MDMQDSTLAQAPESMGHALNEASATAADAGTETNAALLPKPKQQPKY